MCYMYITYLFQRKKYDKYMTKSQLQTYSKQLYIQKYISYFILPSISFMFYGFLFFFWMILGSFGSVLSSRLGQFTLTDIRNGNKKLSTAIKSILRGRSACPSCHHTLHAIDLFPIFSYASTGGKCRYCKKSISIIYPLLEVGCGLLFVLVWYLVLHFGLWEFGNIGLQPNILLPLSSLNEWVVMPIQAFIHLCLRLLVTRLLYLLLIYDIQTMYLHEPLWLLAAVTTLWLVFSVPYTWLFIIWMRSAIALCFFFCLYWFARFYVRIRFKEDGEGFGSGDVRLAPLIWAQFGLREYLTQWPLFSWIDSSMHFVYYIIVASVLWLLYAGIHKLIAPKKSVRSIPFFPGMIVALWVMMVWIIV